MSGSGSHLGVRDQQQTWLGGQPDNLKDHPAKEELYY